MSAADLQPWLPTMGRDANRLLFAAEQCVRNFPRYHKYQVGAARKEAIDIPFFKEKKDMTKTQTYTGAAHRAGRLAGWLLAGWFGISSVALAQQQTCNANMPLTRPDGRYAAVAAATPAGSEVRDKVTGLIWQRCVVGMVWDGTTCTGTASGLTWQQALDAARTATPSTVPAATAWRVPNNAELLSLVEWACSSGINTTWFPATPLNGAWSSSTEAYDNSWAWLFYFGSPASSSDDKSKALRVRLVRSGQ